MTKSQVVNTRELALQILLKILEEGEYSSVVLPEVLKIYQYLEKQDRAFLSRLCEGTIERVIELDYIINQFSKVKTKKMKPVIRNILRMGVYQIKYMSNVPSSAACNESVKIARKKGFSGLSGFVNGILRNIDRNIDKIVYPDSKKEPVDYLSITYSIPEWIVEMWLADYGMELTEKMLLASMKDRFTSIRCNTEKTTVEELRNTLEKLQVKVESGKYVEDALAITSYNYLNDLQPFKDGWFTVQDESSMLVALVAGIKHGDKIIDVCSAPGGKSLHAAQLLEQTGHVSARDLTEQKVLRVKENIKRLGMENIEAKVFDARELEKENVGMADIVIADLPCSGLGVIGKKNDIKYKVTKESIEDLVKLQREILSVVQAYVKKDGVLIYSTCTVNKKENEENMRWFAKEYGFELESLEPYISPKLWNETTKKGYLQLVPGVVETDGFFLARFRKK